MNKNKGDFWLQKGWKEFATIIWPHGIVSIRRKLSFCGAYIWQEYT